MTRDRERRLVELLAQKMKDRALDWKASIGKDSYVLSFTDSSIVIGPDQNHPKKQISIEVTNNEGSIVDRFSSEDLARHDFVDPGQWSSTLQEIHNGARRTVLRADVIIESILEKLDSRV